MTRKEAPVGKHNRGIRGGTHVPGLVMLALIWGEAITARHALRRVRRRSEAHRGAADRKRSPSPQPTEVAPGVYCVTVSWPAAKRSIAALARLEPNVLVTGHGPPMSGTGTARALRAFADRCAGAGCTTQAPPADDSTEGEFAGTDQRDTRT